MISPFDKPVVLFSKSKGCHITLSGAAMVYPIDHPDRERVSNTKLALTSKVIKTVYENDIVVEFETTNTRYKQDPEQ